VMVEGGASILRQFINAGCWNEARIEISPVVLTKGIKAPEVGMRNAIHMHVDGNDILVLKKCNCNCKLQ
ncbi:MAG: dihydrofolate reductase family protein, partial [Muribaculaceae bacterium]|nr:dihydrofolate reductase family protein [Muribaculaceae bacterium]